jgi:hypothetical protein
MRMAALLIVLPILSGCTKVTTRDAELCSKGPSVTQVMDAYKQADQEASRLERLSAQADACVVWTAFQYAGAKDGAEVVAKAVLDECRPHIDAYRLAEPVPPVASEMDEAELLRERLQAKALNYVIRARAGHCVVP